MDVRVGHSLIPYVISWTYFSLNAFGQHWESGGKTTCIKWYSPLTTWSHHVTGSTCTALKAGLDWTCSASQWPHCPRSARCFCFHDPITEDVDDMELWCQTWLVTSVSSATWPVRTAHCHWIELNSTAQAHRSSDKLDVTLAVSSAQSAVPSHTSPPAGTRSTSNCPQPSRTINGWTELNWMSSKAVLSK